MAAPVVSGAAALMLTQDWTLTPDTVKARLMKTATKSLPMYSTAVDPVTNVTYTSQYDLFTIGAGYVDVWGALNSTDIVPAGVSAVSPVGGLRSVDQLGSGGQRGHRGLGHHRCLGYHRGLGDHGGVGNQRVCGWCGGGVGH